MMKKTLLLVATLALALISCKQNDATGPMFWTWLEEVPEEGAEAVFARMEEAGLDAVMINVVSEENLRQGIELARKHHLAVYAWIKVLNLPKPEREFLLANHPDWFSVNRNGESLKDTKAYVGSYKFLCPAHPDVRKYLVDKVEELCKIDGVEGFNLDYCRYVDRILPISLAHLYDIQEDGEVDPHFDFGYHPLMLEKFREQYGYDPREQADPTRDEKWSQFRCDQVTEVANLMIDAAHRHGRKVTASPFPTPKMAAFMVGQDWGKWNLDYVHPMLYVHFYTMDPSFAFDCCVENRRDGNPATKLMCGINVELGGDPATVFEKMDAAFRGGAQGVSLYTSEGLDTPELRARFKVYADSLRAVRAANGGVVPCDAAASAERNPLEHKEMMRVIERNIQRMVAGEPLHDDTVNGLAVDDPAKTYPALDLGPYELVRKNDRLEVFTVEDRASGRRFEVWFLTYGDVVSGWDILPTT